MKRNEILKHAALTLVAEARPDAYLTFKARLTT